jgi:hypothetical protein
MGSLVRGMVNNGGSASVKGGGIPLSARRTASNQVKDT